MWTDGTEESSQGSEGRGLFHLLLSKQSFSAPFTQAGLGLSLSNLFLPSSPGSVPRASPLHIVPLYSKFGSHSSPGSQPYSVSIVSLPTCARDLLQHLGPWFFLSPVVQPDCGGLLGFYTHFTFSLYELALCCIFSPSLLLLRSVHRFFAMLFLRCWSYWSDRICPLCFFLVLIEEF